MVKARINNQLSDDNFPMAMRTAIEGPKLESVNFNEIKVLYCALLIIHGTARVCVGGDGGGEGGQ